MLKKVHASLSLVFLNGNWAGAFLFSIAIALGLTPKMLPMIVTSNLANGAITMSRKQVIVKELNAIHNLGVMDVLCTDKTGTIRLICFVFKANTPQDAALFHTGWFVIGLITRIVVVHIIRTQNIPFIQSRAGMGITLSTMY